MCLRALSHFTHENKGNILNATSLGVARMSVASLSLHSNDKSVIIVSDFFDCTCECGVFESSAHRHEVSVSGVSALFRWTKPRRACAHKCTRAYTHVRHARRCILDVTARNTTSLPFFVASLCTSLIRTHSAASFCCAFKSVHQQRWFGGCPFCTRRDCNRWGCEGHD